MSRWWAPILGVLMAVSGLVLLIGMDRPFEELVQIVIFLPVMLFFALIAGMGDQVMTMGGQALAGAGLLFGGLIVIVTWLLSLLIRSVGGAIKSKT